MREYSDQEKKEIECVYPIYNYDLGVPADHIAVPHRGGEVTQNTEHGQHDPLGDQRQGQREGRGEVEPG